MNSEQSTMPMAQVIEGGSDPVGSEYFYRIRHSFCRIPFDRNPTKTMSDPIGFFMKDVGFR
jgi:hypothetical protein